MMTAPKRADARLRRSRPPVLRGRIRSLGVPCALALVLAGPWPAQSAAPTWTQLRAQPLARTSHAMAYAGGDSLLLFGGTTDGYNHPSATWVFNSTRSTWTELPLPPDEPQQRSGHAMAHIGGDRVLLFGGDTPDGPYLHDTWLFDLSDASWTLPTLADGSLRPPPRSYHAMAHVGGDQVLLFGGRRGDDYLADTWIYDLDAARWTDVSPPRHPSARAGHALAAIGGNQVLLFGGYDSSAFLDDTWIYSADAGTWSEMSPTKSPPARAGHAIAHAGDGQALLFGGEDDSGTAGDTWLYELSTADWTHLMPTSSPSPRGGHAMAYVGDDRVALFGGSSDPSDSQTDGTTSVYDVSDGTWTLSPAGPSRMAFIGNDQVLLYGGLHVGGTSTRWLADTWMYDLGADTWTHLPGPAPAARRGYSMAYMGSDQVLLFGGASGTYDSPNAMSDTWLYDVSEGSWTESSTQIHPSARIDHSMAYIGGDKVLLFGGSNTSGSLGDTWLYDRSGGTWTELTVGTHPPARFGPALAYIGADKVLLFGGSNTSGTLSDTWIYELNARAWTNVTPATSPPAVFAPSLAYAGGSNVILYESELYAPNTWQYDLSTRSWTTVSLGTSPSQRLWPAIAHIASDQVLVYGGFSAAGRQGVPEFLSDTWIYDTGLDSDDDGIFDDVETAAPNGGDANHDFILDKDQANVTSLPNAIDGSYLTLSAPPGMKLSQVAAPLDTPQIGGPLNVSFPVGFVSFDLSPMPLPPASVTVQLEFEDAIISNQYWRFGPEPLEATDHWYRLDPAIGNTGATHLSSGGWQLALVDGSRGDDDLSVNGTAVDMGGPGSGPPDADRVCLKRLLAPQVNPVTTSVDPDNRSDVELLGGVRLHAVLGGAILDMATSQENGEYQLCNITLGERVTILVVNPRPPGHEGLDNSGARWTSWFQVNWQPERARYELYRYKRFDDTPIPWDGTLPFRRSAPTWTPQPSSTATTAYTITPQPTVTVMPSTTPPANSTPTPSITPSPGHAPTRAGATATSTLLRSPTPEITLTPNPTAWHKYAGKVCPRDISRVPAVVVVDAIVNPSRYYAWGRRCYENLPPDDFRNPMRTWLGLRNPAVPYHPLYNSVIWRCGCP